MTSIIYVITHCESCFNKRGIFTGRIDSKLTESGHRHAQDLALSLKNKKIDIAYVSPFIRTRQTLKYILKYHKGVKTIVDDRLSERDYGELSGKSKEKYKRDHPDLFPVYHRSYDIAPPGGESMKQVENRVLNIIKEIVRLIKKEGLNVLIVAHGNSIRPIRRYFEKMSTTKMMKLENLRHKVFQYRVN